MKIGTYYYPEQWPRSQWKRDFDSIARLGLQIVHLGEFAWFSMEPAPGDIRLDWLDECVSMAAERKLDVILCTPTAAPPIWLAEIDGVLPTWENGTKMRFGGRRHYTPTSPALFDAAARIVSALATRFENHPSVIGWQIDNEFCGNFDQSEQTHRAFRDWLKAKYQTLDNLHRAWGSQFWNAYFTSFEQIQMPPSRGPSHLNPHILLDASRFWSSAYAKFNRMQADLLRPHVGDRFIATNFMSFVPDVNPEDMAPDLSMMTWDSYPVTGWTKDVSDERFRIGDLGSVGFMHDYMASFHKRWAIMELQPGRINWGPAPVLPMPGAIRLWLWTAFAHGAEFVTTYRFRQVLFGSEIYHGALMEPDGITPSPGGREFAQTIEEMKRLDLSGVPDLADEHLPAETVGLVFDWEQYWWYTSLPLAKRWNFGQWVWAWQRAIARMGMKVQILRPRTPWPMDLAMIVAPGLQMIDESTIGQMTKYANGGGHLVLTCRSGWMDRDGHLHETLTAAAISPLIKARVREYDGLPEGKMGRVTMDGMDYEWGAWGDLLEPEETTEVIARYADQFYAGTAAITQAKHGSGVVTYVGVCAEQPMLEALMPKLLPGNTQLPAHCSMLTRGPYRVFMNYGDIVAEAPAPKGAKFVIGERTTPAAGVAVWVEERAPRR